MPILQRAPKGYQQLTVSTVALSLTMPTVAIDTGPTGSTVKKNVNFALIRCSTANVRWRDDGTAPTSSVGVPMNAGEALEYDGNPAAIQFIRSGAADATLDIAYYG